MRIDRGGGRTAARQLIWAVGATALLGATSLLADSPMQALSREPLSFLPLSAGQGRPPTWAATSARYRATMAPNALRLRSRAAGVDTLTLSLLGARSDASATPLDPLRRSTIRFEGGETPSRSGGRHYGRLRFAEVYPGIDLLYYGRGEELEYDFLAAPGADLGGIRIGLEGPAAIQPDGSLRLGADGGFVLAPPQAYQPGPDGDQPVECAFALVEPKTAAFVLGAYDPALPLVIDPRVGLATYLGGETADRIFDIHADEQGAVWVAGATDSFDFPLPPQAFPVQPAGGSDVFATKLVKNVSNPAQPVWEIETTVILGGAADDRAVAVTVGADGSLYVMGETRSDNFPVSPDALQPRRKGGSDAFLAVLRETDFPFFQLRSEDSSPAQNAFTNYEIEFATLLGGSEDELVEDGFLAPLAQDNAVPCVALVGLTDSATFPSTLFAVQTQKAGGSDAFFSFYCREPGGATLYNLTYSTFLGGNREELDARAGVADSGAFCIGLRTSSPGLPAPGFQAAPAGTSDFYASCHTPIRRRFGLPFTYQSIGGTFYGGSENETLSGMVLQNGVVGQHGFRLWTLLESPSSDIPERTTLPAPPAGASRRNPGSRSLLVAAFDATLKQLQTQFWIGGGAIEQGGDLAWRDGCLAIAGRTRSADFPLSETFPQGPISGGSDALVAKYCFDSQLQATREYSGFYGSSAEDVTTAIAMGPEADEFVAGHVDYSPAAGQVGQTSPGLVVTPNAPQQEFHGGQAEGFVLEFFRPRLERRAIVGAADFQERPIAPGQILSLFGVSIGPDVPLGAQFDAQGRLATRLGPTRVLFDGVAAPLVFAAKNQVSVVAPFFLAERASTRIEIEVDGAPSLPVQAQVAATSPAVFSLNQSGSGQGAVLHQDFSVNGPNHPVSGGEAIQIFLTGGGQTTPPGVDGELTPVRQPFPLLVAAPGVTVRIGGQSAQVLYAGGAPGLLQGVNQINALVPRGLPASSQTPLEISIGGRSIQPGITIAVR
ncbi:MAG: hypothetical protein GC160_06600 [Acidobacteria bacterium]|nr:hypothetical protein [Acidobacteriota bacterium]